MFNFHIGSFSEFFSHWFNKSAYTRNASFELLRIYACLLVILHHLLNAFPFNSPKPQFKYNLALRTIVSSDISEFILISSYFSCTRPVKMSRFIPFIIQVYCYTLGFYLYAIYKGRAKFEWEQLITYLTPFMHTVYWYPGAFLVSQFLFQPIYFGLRKMNKNFHRLLIIVYVYMASTSLAGNYWTSIAPKGFKTTIHMFILFQLIGSYIRFHEIKPPLFICILGTIFFTFISILCCYGTLTPLFGNNSFLDLITKRSYLSHSPFSIITSVFLFLIFLHVKIPTFISVPINILSRHVFGVYIGHTHPLIYKPIFKKSLKEEFKKRKIPFLKFSLISILKTYFIFTLIDAIRSVIFNFFIFNRQWYARFASKIDSRFEEVDQHDRSVEAIDQHDDPPIQLINAPDEKQLIMKESDQHIIEDDEIENQQIAMDENYEDFQECEQHEKE